MVAAFADVASYTKVRKTSTLPGGYVLSPAAVAAAPHVRGAQGRRVSGGTSNSACNTHMSTSLCGGWQADVRARSVGALWRGTSPVSSP